MLCCSISFCHAQIDTQLVIETIEVKALPDQIESQFVYDSVRIMYYFGDFAPTIIVEKSHAYIKSYGSGSLATLSIRGGNANQALVKWNNIPITNPMLGISDLSLIPMTLFEHSYIQTGGHTISEGNGAMTGVVNFKNFSSHESNKLSIQSTIGSFGNRFFGANYKWKKKSLSSMTKGFYTLADNDFSYKISDNLPLKKQTHANYNSKGFMQNLSLQLNQNNILKLDLWFQKSFREIPPNTTQTNSVAIQNDLHYRYILSHSYYGNNFSLFNQFSYFDENNSYEDPAVLINSDNKFKRWLSQSFASYRFKKDLTLLFNYQYTHISAETEFYNNQKNIDQLAFVISADKRWEHFFVSIGLRKEWNQNTQSPLSPMLHASYGKFNVFKIDYKLSREFRFPTLNELFWMPGGNVDLLPEEGWNQELYIYYLGLKNHEFNVNFYHRLIDNWILWAAEENSFIFNATNLAGVRSYGSEITNKHNFETRKTKNLFSYGYSYTISENQKNLNSPAIKKGDQLFYTPIHKLYFNYQLEHEVAQIGINSTYVSETLGINEDLESYWLLNTSVSKQLKFKKVALETSLNFNNILNTNYRVIERRPMPGRHFSIQLNLTI